MAPLNIGPQLPEVASILGQNSKADYLPRNYVALLGDSYAEGLGDWLTQNIADRTKPYHSADVIRRATGRDVVTFGRGGAGSAEGIVLRSTRALAQCSVFPAIEPPRQIFVYFYEGNDIQDNLHFLSKVNDRYGTYDAPAVDRYLVEQYTASYPWHCHLQLADMAVRMARFVYKYYVIGVDHRPCGAEARDTNRVIVGGRTVELPALQGPALNITDDYVRVGVTVLARSLEWLRKRFAGVPIGVIYIPSPLVVYRPAGDTVTHCFPLQGRPASVPAIEAERHHELIRDLVERVSADQDVEFTDATPALRAAAAASVIHGPHDTDHLNEIGYRALGSLVAARVRSPERVR